MLPLRSERLEPADEQRLTVDLQRLTVDLQLTDEATQAYYNLTGAVNNTIWRQKSEPQWLLELRAISPWEVIRYKNPYF